MQSREQKLLDICYEVAFTVQSNQKWFEGKTKKQIADWLTKQLIENGFDIDSCGGKWGILKEKKKEVVYNVYRSKSVKKK